jgi:hypothetical protein
MESCLSSHAWSASDQSSEARCVCCISMTFFCWRDGWDSWLRGCGLDAEYVTHVFFVIRICVLVSGLPIGYLARQGNSSVSLMLSFE